MTVNITKDEINTINYEIHQKHYSLKLSTYALEGPKNNINQHRQGHRNR